MATPTLPVSMEDEELFGRGTRPPSTPRNDQSINTDHLAAMHSKLSKLWWSRLIIACRGYIGNLYSTEDDNTLFVIDDVFIMLHKRMVEAKLTDALQLVNDMQIVYNCGLEDLAELASGYQMSESQHPFYKEPYKLPFRRLFGLPAQSTFVKAYKQAVAFNYFYKCLVILTERWAEKAGKKKGIRFEEDPEWQPDDRVVLFQAFFKGNRTWVMMDFDRHILKYHKPNGVSVIFGDRYLHNKLQEGYRLCSNCGMIEQKPEQFLTCPQCDPQRERGPACYCSPDCLNENLPLHMMEHS